MKQQSFSHIEYGGRTRISKREEFLDIMDEIMEIRAAWGLKKEKK